MSSLDKSVTVAFSASIFDQITKQTYLEKMILESLSLKFALNKLKYIQDYNEAMEVLEQLDGNTISRQETNDC